MHFGLSTHLFHGERLSRAHVAAISAHGFDVMEVFATRTHFDYHDGRRIGELRGWLDELHVSAASMHAPICTSFVGGLWGRAFSNATAHAGRRQEAIAETIAAIEAARQLG